MITVARRWISAEIVLTRDASGVEVPPAEFRIFPAGKFSTTKGDFLFDEAAAKSVMAAYKAQGVDLMIDLEHLALGDLARTDAPDARGWFKLELRNGELWAVGIKWTPDGARRLAEKTQRYTSPAFYADEDGRITEVINVALVAMPATHNAAPLVAAGRGGAPPARGYTEKGRPSGRKLTRMNPDDVKAALDAIEAGDTAKGLEILKSMIAAAAGGGAPASSGTEATSDTAEVPPDEKAQEEMAALRKQVEALTKGQAEEITALRATVHRLEGERSEKDLTERRTLTAELVKCGAETPATAWEGKPEDQKPAAHLLSMPLPALRDRVKALSAGAPRVVEPPKSGAAEIKLSKAEQAYCEKHKLTPEQFQARKASAARTATAK